MKPDGKLIPRMVILHELMHDGHNVYTVCASKAEARRVAKQEAESNGVWGFNPSRFHIYVVNDVDVWWSSQDHRGGHKGVKK